MKNKVIETILKAEQEAENIISKAKEQSLKIVADAEEKSQKIKAQAQEDAKTLTRLKIEESEKRATLEHQQTLAGYEEEANRVEVKAKNNFDEAIKLIIKNI